MTALGLVFLDPSKQSLVNIKDYSKQLSLIFNDVMRKYLFMVSLALVCLASCSKASEVLYLIEKNRQFGFIDSLGREVIPPQYIMAGQFHNGLAFVVTDTSSVHNRDTVYITYGYINTDNRFVIKPDLHYFIARDNSLFGLLGQEDDPLSPNAIYSLLENRIGFPADGLAMYQSSDGLFGFIDKTGKVVIEAKYKDAKIFSEGKAPVSIVLKEQIDNSGKPYVISHHYWGCVDTKGNTVIDFIFQSIDVFHNDRSFAKYMATVERNSDIDGVMIKDEDGNWVLDTTKAVTGTEARMTPVINEYLIDAKGNIISDPLGNLYVYGGYTKSGFSNANPNVLGAVFGISAYYLDKQGNKLKPGGNLTEAQINRELSKPHKIDILPENAVLTECDRFSSGFASVCAGEGKWLYVDTNLIICGQDEGNWLYEDARPFSSGLAAIKLDGKYGYIDKNFKLVIPCQFDTASYFEGPLAYVTKSKDGVTISSYINKNGEIVWQKIENDLEL